jgi:hypothetical protein
LEALTKSPPRFIALPAQHDGTSVAKNHKDTTTNTKKAMTLDAMRKTSSGCESALEQMSSSTGQLDDAEPLRKLSREPLITIVEDSFALIYPEQCETNKPKQSAPAGGKSVPAQPYVIVSDI